MKTKQKKGKGLFFFTNADTPDAAAVLRRMTQNINLPLIGLIVKVNEADEVVNFEIADEQTVKSLAIVNAPGKE